MTEQEGREAVVREALTWKGTPFAWEMTMKGVGVDCGRFLAVVFNNAGVKNIDITSFPKLSPQWFLHKHEDVYLNQLRRFAVEYELQPGQIPQPGDLIVVKQGHDWAHSALVIEWPKVIGSAHGFVVTVWPDFYKSPQYGNRQFKCLNPWAPTAGGNRD